MAHVWEISPNKKQPLKIRNSPETKKVLDKIEDHLKKYWFLLDWTQAQRRGNKIRIETTYSDLYDVFNNGLLRTLTPTEQESVGIEAVT